MSEIIVLGSGSSTGVPTPLCVVDPTDPPCEVCHKAMALPPEINRNYRCNPSIMIRYVPQGTGGEHDKAGTKYIQIDCGKCYREQVLRWYTRHKIPRMDALILTHEHADAILGLDDIRGLQPFATPDNPVPRVPVFVTQHTMDSVVEKFGYLVSRDQQEALYSKSKSRVPVPDLQPTGPPSAQPSANGIPPQTQENSGKPAVFRRVTQLDWKLIAPDLNAPFDALGLEIIPLPVMHGDDYVSLGFEFGDVERAIYISDVSRIPDETMEFLQKRRELKGRPKLLIVDCLHYTKPHETHFWFPETLEAIEAIDPETAYMIGMTHQFDHDAVNKELKEWSERHEIQVELSWDGLVIPINL